MRKIPLIALALMATRLVAAPSIETEALREYVIPVDSTSYTYKLYEEENYQELLDISREGCFAGDRNACLIDATLTATSRYGVMDTKEAVRVAAPLCEKGETEACEIEAMAWLMRGQKQYAKPLLKTACDKGRWVKSCSAYGIILYGEKDTNATRYLKRACDGGSSVACETLKHD